MKKALLPITLITILSVLIYSCSSNDDDSSISNTDNFNIQTNDDDTSTPNTDNSNVQTNDENNTRFEYFKRFDVSNFSVKMQPRIFFLVFPSALSQ